jgi:phage shock protein PspC (stress-responsive transcriptional regulator)
MTMRTVNTISLNGNAWQIEAEGYQALADYLKSAETRLAADPDRDEILADLEQAIADKLSRHVSAHKNVVSAEEIALSLKEMGPVETGAPAGPAADAAAFGPGAAPAAPDSPAGAGPDTRHLFQIREGGLLSGVCNGLAAYFGVDVTLVRVIFVVFAVLTAGMGALAYLVMMVVVPVAVTAEQMAQAHGKPFSAEELIGRSHAAFTAGRHWREQWRDQRRMWREQRRQWRRQRRGWNEPGAAPPPPPPYGWQGAAYPGHYGPAPVGLGPVSALVQALLLIAFLAALAGAISGRPLMGWDWEEQVPRWVGIVAVCVIYGTLAKQVRMARYFGHVAAYNPGHALMVLIGTVVWLLILLSMGWYVAHHWPQVQDFLQRAVQAVQDAFGNGPPRNTVST